METPVLVIMAAGMGSRYGGLKQIDPVDREGHIIMDFSIYDAVRAGFKKVFFIIKEENALTFRQVIGDRLSKYADVEYVFQEISNIPSDFTVPEGRVKPWGTGHAVLSCYGRIQGPFAVINADDYYGPGAFEKAFKYLSEHKDTDQYQYMMVGYRLGNTLTENGHVSRGICMTDEKQLLVDIAEKTWIEGRGSHAEYTEDSGESWHALPMDTIVSMNMWGFTNSMLEELKSRFHTFLENSLKTNPQKCEYFLPFVVDQLLKEEKAVVKVEISEDKWYGVTYKEDKPGVIAAIQNLKDQGVYPQNLWE